MFLHFFRFGSLRNYHFFMNFFGYAYKICLSTFNFLAFFFVIVGSSFFFSLDNLDESKKVYFFCDNCG